MDFKWWVEGLIHHVLDPVSGKAVCLALSATTTIVVSIDPPVIYPSIRSSTNSMS